MKTHLRADGDTALCDDSIREPLTIRLKDVTCTRCLDMTKAKIGGNSCR